MGYITDTLRTLLTNVPEPDESDEDDDIEVANDEIDAEDLIATSTPDTVEGGE